MCSASPLQGSLPAFLHWKVDPCDFSLSQHLFACSAVLLAVYNSLFGQTVSMSVSPIKQDGNFVLLILLSQVSYSGQGCPSQVAWGSISLWGCLSYDQNGKGFKNNCTLVDLHLTQPPPQIRIPTPTHPLPPGRAVIHTLEMWLSWTQNWLSGGAEGKDRKCCSQHTKAGQPGRLCLFSESTIQFHPLRKIKGKGLGSSLVLQWLRIHLAMQGTWVASLVGELRCHKPLSS